MLSHRSVCGLSVLVVCSQSALKIRTALRATFAGGVTRPIQWRQNQLYQLARMAHDERDAICDALKKDLGKPRTEVLMAEVGVVVERL